MQIRLTGKQNIFIEVFEEYKKLILYGVLKEGEKLPSCRNLGLELGINPNTVERAYSMLEKEGFVTSLPKKGIYVSYNSKNTDLLTEARKQLQTMRDAGVTYEEATEMIENIYREREDK